jgi:TPR repeat protein
MSREDDNNISLVPSQLAALSRTGGASLAARGLHDLLDAESADQWLRKSRDLFAQHRNEESVACIWRGLKMNPNHAELQFSIGLHYKHGWGIAWNDAEAVRWFRKAAEQGHAGAQCALGEMYENGRSVPEDYVQAAIYYREAAEQGHEGAQYRLGKIYDEGRGVAKDYVQAAVWYEKAAGQGQVVAQYALSWMYKDGKGVPKNDIQAGIWWRKANDTIKAMKRENLEKRKP